MRRRDFITLVSGTALSLPLAAHAQPSMLRKIGVLVLGDPDPAPFLRALREGLRELGYHDGQDIQFVVRSADGKAASLTPLAAELVALKVSVIVAYQTLAATTAKQATKSIPIVMTAGDPVGTGLIASLAHPGGNVTGATPSGAELAAKNLELIHEVLPSARHVAVFANATDPFREPFLQHIQDGATRLDIAIKPVLLRSSDELETEFANMKAWQTDALIIQPSIAQQRLVDMALQNRLATASHLTNFIRLGGLISYSADLEAVYRRCAYFVDKILKGSRPADLPVELAAKFWLGVNLKTAKTLGIAVPSTVLSRADEVIE
jgi:putative ABC transport system substrate-binding protein